MFTDSMDTKRLWLGLVVFSIGTVLFINQGNILSNNGNYDYSPTGWRLLTVILFQILVLIMLFGGLTLMALSWDWNWQKPK